MATLVTTTGHEISNMNPYKTNSKQPTVLTIRKVRIFRIKNEDKTPNEAR